MHKGYVSEIFSSFQGEGLFAGRRHVFLRMAGCNLRCGYCDTPDSLERTAGCTIQAEDGSDRTIPNPLGVEQLAGLLVPFYRGPGVHALAVTGGEPLVQADFLAELFVAAPPPVPVLLETNGTYPERLRAVLPWIEILSVDVKLPSNSGERGLWDEHRAFLEAGRGKNVYVKVPVDEGTSDDEVRRAAALVAETAADASFFLQPIIAPDCGFRISIGRLERFYDLAAESLRDVRVLPQTHKFLGVR